MNDATNGILLGLVGVLTLIAVFSMGFAFHDNKIIHHCQNFEKFTAQGKVYECKEVGVAK